MGDDIESQGSWRPGIFEAAPILFLDDCVTSVTTARLCHEALVGLGNKVDGLIWVSPGGDQVGKVLAF